MVTHNLKIKQCFADAIVKGEKNFEIRYNDRGYQTGDEIKFNVIDNITGEPIEEHFIHKLTYKITKKHLQLYKMYHIIYRVCL